MCEIVGVKAQNVDCGIALEDVNGAAWFCFDELQQQQLTPFAHKALDKLQSGNHNHV